MRRLYKIGFNRWVDVDNKGFHMPSRFIASHWKEIEVMIGGAVFIGKTRPFFYVATSGDDRAKLVHVVKKGS